MKDVIEGWIARDDEPINGKTNLWLYKNQPIRREASFYSMDVYALPLTNDMFPQLTWEDEPQKVKVTIETIEE